MDPDVPRPDPASSTPVPRQQSLPPTLHSGNSSPSASSGRKRRRPVDRQQPDTGAAYPTQGQQGDAPSASSSHQTLTGVSPRPGSPPDSGTMQRSASPEEGGSGLRYTRTGRVSRALKGQRVHHCEECGKVRISIPVPIKRTPGRSTSSNLPPPLSYPAQDTDSSRRRHQQNHRPGLFPCDIPGCTRSFNREDLLIRHKLRHNDPQDPPTRRGSFGSSNSAPGEEPTITAALRPAISAGETLMPAAPQVGPAAPMVAAQDHDQRRSPRKGYLKINELPPMPRSLAPNIITSGPDCYTPNCDDWAQSPQDFLAPVSIYGTTPSYAPPMYGPYENVPYESPEYDGYMYHVPPHSRSPVSAGSSSTMAHMPFLNPPHGHEFPYNGYGSSFPDARYCLQLPSDQNYSLRITQEMMADARDLQERDELATPTTAPQSSHELDSSLDASTLATEQRYLECFWNQIHPQYPIIYRPLFSLTQTSPLLKAAILALGSQAQGTRIDIENSRILHDRCIRVIKKRTGSNRHTFRVADMQALFLIELFALFKARRFPTTFSKPFENMCSKLADDEECFHPAHTDDNAHNEVLGDEMLHTLFRYDREAKQRLLAACYILDSQCALLFGRTKIDFLSNRSAEVIFPRPLSAWDDEEMHDVAAVTVELAAHSTTQSRGLKASRLDGFQLMLLLLYSIESTGQQAEPTSNDLNLAANQQDRIRMAYHTLMLCNHAPMRDLLAVAGESWVLTEKISCQAEFTLSQLETRNWAHAAQQLDYNPAFGGVGLQPDIQHALYHAFEILKIQSRLQNRTSLVCHEWSVYLATIVVWARAYVVSPGTPAPSERRPSRPRLSIPSPTEPTTSLSEVEQSVSALLQAGFAAPLSWKEAKSVLLWTRHKVHATSVLHYSGLTNMALDVLGKLAIRGNEDGWF
ncbi:hypothetical protein K431DRAFT_4819 [Polychaeton citri CBS 116435]|uniref:C2H2-type domain-containing protein n=1 Tax=Polychaeton citri CBS 116435 TaxID=1314669 RepID=A0A9P4UUW8_9PEZI|nr:hypothetical protein K431DRAFT_4819 [Polychaeton citri CBS 116435]